MRKARASCRDSAPSVDADLPAHLTHYYPQGQGQQHRVERRGSNEEVAREIENVKLTTRTGRLITNALQIL